MCTQIQKSLKGFLSIQLCLKYHALDFQFISSLICVGYTYLGNGDEKESKTVIRIRFMGTKVTFRYQFPIN